MLLASFSMFSTYSLCISPAIHGWSTLFCNFIAIQTSIYSIPLHKYFLSYFLCLQFSSLQLYLCVLHVQCTYVSKNLQQNWASNHDANDDNDDHNAKGGGEPTDVSILLNILLEAMQAGKQVQVGRLVTLFVVQLVSERRTHTMHSNFEVDRRTWGLNGLKCQSEYYETFVIYLFVMPFLLDRTGYM